MLIRRCFYNFWCSFELRLHNIIWTVVGNCSRREFHLNSQSLPVTVHRTARNALNSGELPETFHTNVKRNAKAVWIDWKPFGKETRLAPSARRCHVLRASARQVHASRDTNSRKWNSERAHLKCGGRLSAHRSRSHSPLNRGEAMSGALTGPEERERERRGLKNVCERSNPMMLTSYHRFSDQLDAIEYFSEKLSSRGTWAERSEKQLWPRALKGQINENVKRKRLCDIIRTRI